MAMHHAPIALVGDDKNERGSAAVGDRTHLTVEGLHLCDRHRLQVLWVVTAFRCFSFVTVSGIDRRAVQADSAALTSFGVTADVGLISCGLAPRETGLRGV